MRIIFQIIGILAIVALIYFIVTSLLGVMNDDEIDSEVTMSNQAGNAATSTLAESSPLVATQALVTTSGRLLFVNRFSQIEGVTDVGSKMYHLDTDAYGIMFNEANSSFAISITQQPVLATRDVAVNQLARLLGVAVIELCDVNIYISTTQGFDSTYAGKNIGLGACSN